MDSGVRAGGEVSPMYDPMVAKLIVWDADRAQATERMLRALAEFEIEGLKTLIPFHQALLATEQWAQGRDLPRPRRGPQVAEDARLPAARRGRAADRRDEDAAEETVEQTYTVEVSGKRFDVRVLGPPFAGGARRAGRRAGASNGASATAQPAGPGARSASPRAAAARTRCPRRCRATCGRCSSSRATPSRRASCCASSRR